MLLLNITHIKSQNTPPLPSTSYIFIVWFWLSFKDKLNWRQMKKTAWFAEFEQIQVGRCVGEQCFVGECSRVVSPLPHSSNHPLAGVPGQAAYRVDTMGRIPWPRPTTPTWLYYRMKQFFVRPVSLSLSPFILSKWTVFYQKYQMEIIALHFNLLGMHLQSIWSRGKFTDINFTCI